MDANDAFEALDNMPAIDELDDLFRLPILSDPQRQLVTDTRATLARLTLPKVSSPNGVPELRECVRLLGAAGLLKHCVAEGTNLELTPLCLVREEIARVSVIGDLAFVMQALGSLPIQLAGTPEQREQWLPSVSEGSVVAAFALSEPEAGSDVAALTCAAVRDGDDYVLNGTKWLITNAGAADVYCLFARTSEGSKGISAFVVPAQSDGLQIRDMVPISSHPLGRLDLKNVRIPASSLIGREGEGLKIALSTLSRCRLSVAAASNGFARRAIEASVHHVRRRKAFGSVLADQQLVQSLISHNVTELDAARLLTWRAMVAFDAAPQARHDRASSEAKWYATEAAQRIIDRSLQMCGGLGVLKGNILGELYQAIRPLRIYEGASEVQQVVIARSLLATLDEQGGTA